MNENEVFAYMMANEKMVEMLCIMENNFEFFQEYKIKADEEVKKSLHPILEKYRNWIK